LKKGFVDRKYCGSCINFHGRKEKMSTTRDWQCAQAHHKTTQNMQNMRKTINLRAILALSPNLVSNCGMWDRALAVAALAGPLL
jgi:NADH:ubiquinone oxidoreductase subunit F (NADH-binding)